MRDIDKTKEQLINELTEMRQRTIELETSETKRKRTEEALRESQHQHRLLCDSMGNGMFVIDAETRMRGAK
jgi:PAS domain-containing protein